MEENQSKNTLQLLPYSSQLLTTLVEKSFDSILITDLAGNITYANEAFKTLTGYTSEDVIGKSPRILQGSATDKTTLDRLSASMKSGGNFEGKAINYKKDGTAFIMHWKVMPVKSDSEEIVAWVAIQREGYSI
jgi:PAS domain S-box-containing protein